MLQTIIQRNLKAQLNGKAIKPILISGRAGIGKSASVKGAAKELGATVYEISIPSTPLELMSGLPEFVDTKVNYSISGINNVRGTIWSVPELVASANRMADANPNGCIILIDDLHEANKSMEAVMYQLLLERRLGDFALRPNVAIVATMNDTSASNFKGISAAVKSRLNLLEYKFIYTEYMEKFGNKLHYVVSTFLQDQPQFALEVEHTKLEASGNPRNYEFLSNELKLYREEEIAEMALPLARQYMSREASLAMETHINYIMAMNMGKTVKDRVIIDINKAEPVQQILYAHISNYCHTVEDAAYLTKLIKANITSESFIGFLAANLRIAYEQYSNDKETGSRALLALISYMFEDNSLITLTATEEKAYKQIKLSKSELKTILDVFREYIL